MLKRCPFCDNDMSSFAGMTPDAFAKGDADFAVNCECHAVGPFRPTMEEAVSAWNTRGAAQAPSIVEVASVIHDARFGPDYPEHLRNSFEGECASGRAYCIKLARAVLDSFRLSHIEASPVSSTTLGGEAREKEITRLATIEECARLAENTGLRNPENIARDIRALALTSTNHSGGEA